MVGVGVLFSVPSTLWRLTAFYYAPIAIVANRYVNELS